MRLDEMDLESAAIAAAGNWQEFTCFAWHDQPDDPENWAIIYTHNRDSGLLDQSNAAAIEKALRPFARDVVPEVHNHWACGWVEGFSIRVFRRGHITKAFQKYHELAQRLADYPILNGTDYNAREYEATIKNLADAAWKLKHEYELPEDWKGSVYDWFASYDCSAIENNDDGGGYPCEEQLRTAFDAIGYNQLELV